MLSPFYKTKVLYIKNGNICLTLEIRYNKIFRSECFKKYKFSKGDFKFLYLLKFINFESKQVFDK